MIRRDTVLKPVQWSEEIACALTPALDGAQLDAFEKDVKAGVLQLWECNGCYVVTEVVTNYLRVWLVGGKNFVDAAHAINNKAHECGYNHVRYRTRNPASLRMYAFLQPELINADMHEYRVWPF